MSNIQDSAVVLVGNRECSPKRSRNSRIRRQSVLDMNDEYEPPRIPNLPEEELSFRVGNGKLTLDTSIRKDQQQVNNNTPSPHSAPAVVAPNQAKQGQKRSLHRRSFSIHSLAGSFRDSDLSSPSTTRVVGRLSSLLKRESSSGGVLISQSDFRSSNPEAHKLDLLVLNRKERRDALVDQLLAEHARDAVLKVRFITAYHEWNKIADLKGKKHKGRKLIAVFLEPNSMFYLHDVVPKEIQDVIHQGNHVDGFARLKDHLLNELVTNPNVLNYLRSRCIGAVDEHVTH